MKIREILANVNAGTSSDKSTLNRLKRRILELVEDPEKEVSDRIATAILDEIASASSFIINEELEGTNNTSSRKNHVSAVAIATYLNGLQGVVKIITNNNESVESLEMSWPAKNSLLNANIATIGLLVTMSSKDILGLKSTGPSRLWQIRNGLAKRGLHLKGDEKWFDENKSQ